MEEQKRVPVEMPVSLQERLRERAKRNDRSMRAEALAIIKAALWHDEAVREDPDVPTYTLHATCAWCGKDLGDKATTDAASDGMTSHGICSECADRMRG